MDPAHAASSGGFTHKPQQAATKPVFSSLLQHSCKPSTSVPDQNSTLPNKEPHLSPTPVDKDGQALSFPLEDIPFIDEYCSEIEI